MKEYRLEVRVKNNWLWWAIKGCGFKTQKEFAEAAGVRYCNLGTLLSMKRSALTRDGSWCLDALRIAEYLDVFPEEIFPPKAMRGIETNIAVRELSEDELSVALEGPMSPEDYVFEKEKTKLLSDALSQLRPREERVVRARFGLNTDEKTLEEVGKDFGRSRDRIRQIECKALRKLKHPKREKLLRELWE